MPVSDNSRSEARSRAVGHNCRMSNLISWSKHGFIAYTSTDAKYNLLLTYLENVDGRSWQLAKPQQISVEIGNSFVPELALLRWSSLSTDLAVADIYGNFFIYLAGVGQIDRNAENASVTSSGPSYELTSYNHTEMIYQDIVSSTPTTSSKFIVSFKWLNIEKPQMINQPATLNSKDSNTPISYTYGLEHSSPIYATHPIPTKQACLALRKNGQITLYYQGEHKVEYHKTSYQLFDTFVVLTKASIGFNGKEIIVCAFDSLTSRIYIYSVSIDWGYLVESAKRQKTDSHFHTPKESQNQPTFQVNKKGLMDMMSSFVTSSNDDEDSDKMDLDEDTSTVNFGNLQSIDIVNPTTEKNSKLDILVTYTIQDNKGKDFSTIHRYSLTDDLDLIPEAFDLLASKKSVDTAETIKTQSLTLKGTLQRSGKLLSVEFCQINKFILLYFDDGRIDILNRSSLKVINGSRSDLKTPPSTILTIFDAGFNFLVIDDAVSKLIAVSPNLTSMVCVDLNTGIPELHVARKIANLDVSPQELYTTAVAFAYRHADSCYSNSFSDDLIVLLGTELTRITKRIKLADDRNLETVISNFIETILTESHKSIYFNLDAFGKESVDKLLSNPPLQKLLSLQLSIGEFQNQNPVISDIAWVVLNLRSASFGIMFLLSSIVRQTTKKKASLDTLQDSIVRAESIMSLIGNVRWFVDLMTYIYQELIQLSYYLQDSSNSLLNLQNSIALPVILSKVPRLFLMYALSSISKTNEILKRLHKELTDSNKLYTPMKEALSRFFTISNQAPITLNALESFLRECDAHITKELATKLAGKNNGESLKLEQKLIFRGELTDGMQQLAKVLINRYSQNFTQDIKVSELFFYNTDWLNIGINQHKKSNKLKARELPPVYRYPNNTGNFEPRSRFDEDNCVDGLRKIVMNIKGGAFSKTNNGKLRKCTRCRSISLVTDPFVFESATSIGLWTMVFQRVCICGNSWVNINP